MEDKENIHFIPVLGNSIVLTFVHYSYWHELCLYQDYMRKFQSLTKRARRRIETFSMSEYIVESK